MITRSSIPQQVKHAGRRAKGKIKPALKPIGKEKPADETDFPSPKKKAKPKKKKPKDKKPPEWKRGNRSPVQKL